MEETVCPNCLTELRVQTPGNDVMTRHIPIHPRGMASYSTSPSSSSSSSSSWLSWGNNSPTESTPSALVGMCDFLTRGLFSRRSMTWCSTSASSRPSSLTSSQTTSSSTPSSLSYSSSSLSPYSSSSSSSILSTDSSTLHKTTKMTSPQNPRIRTNEKPFLSTLSSSSSPPSSSSSLFPALSPRPTSSPKHPTHSAMQLKPIILTLLIFLSSLSPARTHTLPTQTATPIGGGEAPTQDSRGEGDGDCVNKTRLCIQPVLGLLRTRMQHVSEDTQETEKLCQDYREVLLCVHSSLVDCPSPAHLESVQRALSSDAVLEFNDFCSIQAHSSSSSRRGQPETDRMSSSSGSNDNSKKSTRDNANDSNDVTSAKTKPNNNNNHNIKNTLSTTFLRKNENSPHSKTIGLTAGSDRKVFDYVDSLMPEVKGDTQVTINVVTIIQNKPLNAEGEGVEILPKSGDRSAWSDDNSSASIVEISILVLVVSLMSTFFVHFSGFTFSSHGA